MIPSHRRFDAQTASGYRAKAANNRRTILNPWVRRLCEPPPAQQFTVPLAQALTAFRAAASVLPIRAAAWHRTLRPCVGQKNAQRLELVVFPAAAISGPGVEDRVEQRQCSAAVV
jgi:hypothetical protein